VGALTQARWLAEPRVTHDDLEGWWAEAGAAGPPSLVGEIDLGDDVPI